MTNQHLLVQSFFRERTRNISCLKQETKSSYKIDIKSKSIQYNDFFLFFFKLLIINILVYTN